LFYRHGFSHFLDVHQILGVRSHLVHRRSRHLGWRKNLGSRVRTTRQLLDLTFKHLDCRRDHLMILPEFLYRHRRVLLILIQKLLHILIRLIQPRKHILL
jgi:hypothetical protein